MFIIALVVLLLGGCVQKSVHDTVESLPRGAYALDRKSFEGAPPALTPYIVQFLRSKGFLLGKLQQSESERAVRYKLYANYSVKNGVATLRLLADNVRSRHNDAVITITRSIDPTETEDQHIRLMVTALDNKYPILSSTGAATCTFIYGDGSRPFWESLKTMKRAAKMA